MRKHVHKGLLILEWVDSRVQQGKMLGSEAGAPERIKLSTSDISV